MNELGSVRHGATFIYNPNVCPEHFLLKVEAKMTEHNDLSAFDKG